MADIDPTLPAINELNSTADPKILAALASIVSTINALDATNLANDAVTTAKILDANVTLAKLASEAWTAYTPTLTQSGTVTATVTSSRYVRIGRTITWAFRLDVTGSGTVSNAITMTVPVTAQYGNTLAAGAGYVYDASGTDIYSATAMLASTTTLQMFVNDGNGFNAFGVYPAVALATGDVISGTVTYEAAA